MVGCALHTISLVSLMARSTNPRDFLAENEVDSINSAIKPLYAFHYPHTRVTVEACKKCAGLWLNSGEFDEINKARQDLPESIESEEQNEIVGVKGNLIRLIDSAIENLMY